MAQIIFKRAVDFNGVVYPINKEVKIPDQLLSGWYLKALIKSGEAVLLSEELTEKEAEEIIVKDDSLVVVDSDSEELTQEEPKRRGRPKR
jgi:hypothetical protein